MNENSGQLPLFPEQHASGRPQPIVNTGEKEPRIIVELAAQGARWPKLIENATRLAAAGITAFSVADNPLANSKPCSIATSHVIQEATGLPAICHLQCRDRNLPDLQSRILGADLLGIRSILALTGDPLRFGKPWQKYKAGEVKRLSKNFDINSIELMGLITHLNCGQGILGEDIGRKTEFLIGASFNPNGTNLNGECRELRRKIAAGSQFAMTQLLYDASYVERLYQIINSIGIPVFVGFAPIGSPAMAVQLSSITSMPDQVIRRLEAANSNTARWAAGVEICKELIDISYRFDVIRAYYLVYFGRIDPLLELIRYIQQLHIRNQLTPSAAIIQSPLMVA